ncbi:hypothetical protein [Arthrobacter sp. 08Y14]|uniref:hypothetical protein n=1 Tax=Arthrobacter sp. 08Y14 TaxID=2058885 RepID=UPI0011B08C17|nr:hypothetical protein [Arthrobacter sp. 08Y14]
MNSKWHFYDGQLLGEYFCRVGEGGSSEDWLLFFYRVWSRLSVFVLSEEPKLSGKSPQGSNEKKPGKSIKDKRAEKRAKMSAESELAPKKRKGN